jgi:hypothetical protein
MGYTVILLDQQKEIMEQFKRRCLREAADRPYDLQLDRITDAHWERLRTAQCSFCNSHHDPRERSLLNIARGSTKRPVTDRNTTPCCPLCWSVRAGKTPRELRAKAGKITHFVDKRRAERYRAVWEQIGDSPSQLSPRQRASLSSSMRREQAKCGATPTKMDQGVIALSLRFPCYYCGEASTGVDRLLSDVCPGYSSRNIVPCCSDCNSMKHILPKSVFLDHMQYISQHSTAR